MQSSCVDRASPAEPAGWKTRWAVACTALFLPFYAHADAREAFTLAAEKQWEEATVAADNNPTLMTLLHWLYVKDKESDASFSDIRAFAQAHPDWPEMETIERRAEQALLDLQPLPETVREWFSSHPAHSGAGKLLLAEARMAQGEPIDAVTLLLRDAWEQGDFPEGEEARILATYRGVLRTADHRARTQRLLWEEKTSAAARMLRLLPPEEVAQKRAWIALLRGEKNAEALLAALTPAQRCEPGILFARVAMRDKQGDADGVAALLLQAPEHVPYPARWWKFRQRAVREAVAQHNVAAAHRLLKHHGQTDGKEAAEARWLKGWVLLESRSDAASAYLEFFRMFEGVRTVVSKSRAAYWAGRAAEHMGDTESARSWYHTATQFPTTFYGQRAAEKLGVDLPLSRMHEPQVSVEDVDAFLRSERGQILRTAIEGGRADIAITFLHHTIDTQRDAKVSAIAARAMVKLGARALSIKAAKRAVQHNLLLVDIGYPLLQLPPNLAIPAPLVLAFTRQESEFDPNARSRAGALGLMQILPSTGKETARSLHLPFETDALRVPDVNLTLGSAYAARLLRMFDGSLPLAIAAYNAGPGRVRSWQAQYGTPPASTDGMIHWLETIPFEETRNYVHRVMENYFVYQQIMAAEGLTPPPALQKDNFPSLP